MTWMPHITVATVIEKQGKFLLVEEFASGTKPVFNQPAGHLDEGESLIEAARRETLEETGFDIEITGYLGVTLYTAPSNGVTYVRHTFAGEIIAEVENAQLDEGIIGTAWLSYEEICQCERLRSPIVQKTIEHFLAQQPLPLSVCY